MIFPQFLEKNTLIQVSQLVVGEVEWKQRVDYSWTVKASETS